MAFTLTGFSQCTNAFSICSNDDDDGSKTWWCSHWKKIFLPFFSHTLAFLRWKKTKKTWKFRHTFSTCFFSPQKFAYQSHKIKPMIQRERHIGLQALIRTRNKYQICTHYSQLTRITCLASFPYSVDDDDDDDDIEWK